QEMRRDLQLGDAGEIGMLVDRQAVLEELLHLARAELPGRQTDVVDHQQGHFALGTLVEVRRGAVTHAVTPAGGRVQPHCRLLEDWRHSSRTEPTKTPGTGPGVSSPRRASGALELAQVADHRLQ